MENWIIYLVIAGIGIASSLFKEWNKSQKKGQSPSKPQPKRNLEDVFREIERRLEGQEQPKTSKKVEARPPQVPEVLESSLVTNWSLEYAGLEQSKMGSTIQKATIDPLEENPYETEENQLNFNVDEARKAIIYQAIMERPYA